MRDYIGEVPSLPGRPTSVWLADKPDPDCPPLLGDVSCDVAVVGAGLAGVMTAFALSRAGAYVILLDARAPLADTTGHTTAKVTIQHGAVYHHLLRTLGEHAALVYAEANMTGLNTIVSLSEELGIDCGLARADSCLYATDSRSVRMLEDEARAMERLGLPVGYAEGPSDAPFDVIAALRLPHQALFDPVAFGLGLLDSSPVQVACGHWARTIEKRGDGRVEVVAEGARISAGSVVIATGYPFWDHAAFFPRLYPHRHYALALEVGGGLSEAMYYPAGDGVAYRPYHGAEGDFAVVSGAPHKAGQGGDERDSYAALERAARGGLGAGKVRFHWSAQDNDTPDRMPFIGVHPASDRVFVATGFGGWGMTSSALAARLISDLVGGTTSPWAEVFDPGRANVTASARSFVSENLNVAGRVVAGRAHHRAARPEHLEPGEGVVTEVDGKPVAMSGTTGGPLAISARCTHMGCTVTWNEAELTWDCPCHGSRFLADGSNLHGPASTPLGKLEERS